MAQQHTSDVLLLGSSLLGAGCLLDVHDEFLFGLVLVDGAGRVVDLIVDVEAVASTATVEPVGHE